jgi:DNA polymerase III subunit epsilon
MANIREIVLDTETTGFDPKTGDRIVEIGCVELEDRFVTGKTFHRYLNPDRDMPIGAFKVHGLSEAFLADKPRFAEIAAEFLAFIGEAPLIIHNASFDLLFLNAELKRIGGPNLPTERAVDTLFLARRKHPGAQNTLDALCARYGIDNSRRKQHGALLDAEILAEVYVELTGGRQSDLGFGAITYREKETGPISSEAGLNRVEATFERDIITLLSDEDKIEHRRFIAELGEKSIWSRYFPSGS